MNGTYKRSRNYRSLALSILGGIGFAALAVPALAAGSGGKGVSVTVNPTTGYTVINSQTIGTPRGTTIGPSGGPPSVTVRPPGGLSQSLPSGIEITGMRENAQTLRGPLGVNLNAGINSLRNAGIRCVKSLRCNFALTAGAAGLQALLDQIDGLLDNPGISRRSYEVDETRCSPVDGLDCITSRYSQGACANASCSNLANADILIRTPRGQDGCPSNAEHGCAASFKRVLEYPNRNPPRNRYELVGVSPHSWDGLGYYIPGTEPLIPVVTTPLTDSEIDDLFDNYSPTPSDWNWLTGGLDLSAPDVTVEVTDLPVLDGSNEPNFIEWSDGTSRGTFNIYTPTVSNNNSSKPEIEVKDQQTEISYDNQGNPTGSNTSTTTLTPSPGGSPSSPEINIPTDCDFMPTVCRFIDWFTEPEPLPDPDQEIKDLVQVYEDGGRQVEVGPSMGSCPPPRVVALSFVPAVEVSFQPFCDLAAAVRYWLLAIAYFGAAYLTVRSI